MTILGTCGTAGLTCAASQSRPCRQRAQPGGTPERTKVACPVAPSLRLLPSSPALVAQWGDTTGELPSNHSVKCLGLLAVAGAPCHLNLGDESAEMMSTALRNLQKS